ncbi:MAG: RNA-binding cell elongation regulator Jag/EloR [Ruthenibacterium sp.]
MREIIMTGKTVEEATAAALAEIGLAEDEVTIEIIDLPQKKLFRTIPAKVKVTSDADAQEAADAAILAAEKAEKQAAASKAAKPAAAPVAVKQDAPVAKPAPQKETPDFTEKPIDLSENLKAREAVEYLSDICAKMGAADLSITAVSQGEAIILKVDGEGAGNLIGHRGEVMEALSYLTGLVANRTGGDYVKVGLDINNYRSKRESNLTALAKRIGAKVAQTGRSHTLEPMNPYERRIIHSAIGELEGVKSESTGEGANRRVVISSTGANAQAGGDRPFRQAGRNRAPRASGAPVALRPNTNKPHSDARPPRKEGEYAPKSNVPARNFADKPRDVNAAPIAPKRTETIRDGGDLPLYGKIEL